jgi:glycerophosphoryl diester phosphodiesterase
MATIIAHRGATAAQRENTVEAFGEAARVGADGVEFDVRRTGDGALVVHHDAVLPGSGPLSNLSVADLPEWLPLFDAALDACEGLLVNVEIKNLPGEPGWDPTEAMAGVVAAVVGGRGWGERVLVSSFALATIDAVRAADPAIPTGWLTLPGYDQHLAVITAAERGHAALHPHHEAVTPALVAAAHGVGMRLVTWTVDDPDRMRDLADWGVDSIITNEPELAVRVLRG